MESTSSWNIFSVYPVFVNTPHPHLQAFIALFGLKLQLVNKC